MVVAGDGGLGEEHRENGACAVDLGRHLGLAEDLLQALLEPLALPLQGGINIGVIFENLQLRQAGGHGNRIARKRARLIDGAQGRDLLHELAATGIGAHRHAAADDLAIGDQVGMDAIVALGAARREAEARDDLVENEQRAVGVAQTPECLQKSRLGRHHAHVGRHRLHDHRGHLAGVGLEKGADRGGVVIPRGERIGGHLRRNAGGIRRAAGEGAGTGLDQHGIRVSMVAAGKLDDFAPAGGAPRQAQGGHDGLGAGIDHAHHLRAGHLGHQLGHLHLDLRGRAEAQAVAHGLQHGLLHRLVAVTQDQRSPGADEVNILVAVHVDDAASLALRKKPGIRSHGAAGADGTVDAAGHHQLGGLEEGFRTRHQPMSPFRMASASSLAK